MKAKTVKKNKIPPLLIEFREHQRLFIEAEAKGQDVSMSKVVRDLVEKEIVKRGLKAK